MVGTTGCCLWLWVFESQVFNWTPRYMLVYAPYSWWRPENHLIGHKASISGHGTVWQMIQQRQEKLWPFLGDKGSTNYCPSCQAQELGSQILSPAHLNWKKEMPPHHSPSIRPRRQRFRRWMWWEFLPSAGFLSPVPGRAVKSQLKFILPPMPTTEEEKSSSTLQFL